MTAMGSTCFMNARSLPSKAGVSVRDSFLVGKEKPACRGGQWQSAPLATNKPIFTTQYRPLYHPLTSAAAKNLHEDTATSEPKGLQPTSKALPMTRMFKFYQPAGDEVTVIVTKEDACFKVRIVVLSMPRKETLYLHWNIFRSSSLDWEGLDLKDLPAGTLRVGESFRSPFEEVDSGVRRVHFEFRLDYAPLFIGCFLSETTDHNPTRTVESRFVFPVGCGRGHPEPLGTTMNSDGSINFALYSKYASAVILCLYHAGSTQPSVEIELQESLNRTGNTWHIELDGIGMFDRYGYRCKGESSWEKGNRFHARRILLDPYAGIVAPFLPGQDCLPSPAAALGMMPTEGGQFDWESDVNPNIPLEQVVAYRLHVTGFTADKSSALEGDILGTFDGLREKIDHFKFLGVNAIILQPIFFFQMKKGSYYPLSFFAPMDCFGPLKMCVSSSHSLKQAIKELHRNGIEVILDVVFTQTGEGNDEAPETITFRGIDNATYYILDETGRVAGSNMGAENRFSCNHPVVQSLILDSLRHWVVNYHVDGFCFLDASSLTNGPHGESLSRPLLVEALSFDPVLSKSKLFADMSFPFIKTSKDSSFPHWKRWCLFNNKYHDDVRQFLRGDKQQLSNFATRLCGSGDILADGRGPSFSLNHVTGPYGLTLVDLVSYSTTIEGDSELSWNSGEEGRTLNQSVLNIRVKQVRNFLMCVFLSQGTPVLNMGDEYGLSKGGSVAVDQRKMFDWDALKLDFGKQTTHLIASLAAFRARRKDVFQRKEFIKLENIHWHGVQLTEPDWDSEDSSFLAVSFSPEGMNDAPTRALGDVYIAFNASNTPVIASLPEPSSAMSWHRIADTSLPYPHNFQAKGVPLMSLPEAQGSRTYEVQSYSSILLEAHEVAI